MFVCMLNDMTHDFDTKTFFTLNEISPNIYSFRHDVRQMLHPWWASAMII